MSEGRDIYAAVKGDMVALEDLPDGDLRQLLGHLGRKGKTCGNAGRIWGEAIAEATVRFMKAKTQDLKTQDSRPEA
jgi:hypothetical protein